MKARDIFGIILRAAALYVCIYGAWYTLAGIKFLPVTFYAAITGSGSGSNSLGWFIYGVPGFFGGLLVLRFAESSGRFTYREKILPMPILPEQPKTNVEDDI